MKRAILEDDYWHTAKARNPEFKQRKHPVSYAGSDSVGDYGGLKPSDIGGLQLWYVAGSGTYQDSARTIFATNNNDPVGGLTDFSGNHMGSQTSNSLRPTLLTNAIHNNTAIRFDGSTQYLTTGTWNLNPPFSVFMAARMYNLASNSEYAIGTNSASSASACLANTSNGLLLTNMAYTVSPSIDTTKFYVWSAVSNGASQGGLWEGQTNKSAGAAVPSPYRDLELGVNRLSGQYGHWDFLELFMYTGTIEETQRLSLVSYLQLKYGI